jgi:hypothetical protein
MELYLNIRNGFVMDFEMNVHFPIGSRKRRGMKGFRDDGCGVV